MKIDDKVREIENKVAISTLPKIILQEVLTTDQFLALPKELRTVNMSEEHLLRIYAMRANGFTVAEIEKSIGYPAFALKSIMASLEYRALVDMIGKDIIESARETLMHATGTATKTLIGLMSSDDERIQLKASTEILNRTGLDAVKHIQVSGKTDHIHHMPQEQLDYILKAAQVANELASKIEITADTTDTAFEEVVEDGE